MKGHEYIREAVRTHLEVAVPVRLAAHLAANALTSPDPADLKFLLADGLQNVKDFPAVVVRSTDATEDTHAGGDTWRVVYDLEVLVAADHRVYGDVEGASQDRDRVLLAVRESIYSATGLTEDIDIFPSKRSERTGAADESLTGVPLAVGRLKFRAAVVESLTDLTPPETILAVDQNVTGYSADQTLP